MSARYAGINKTWKRRRTRQRFPKAAMSIIHPASKICNNSRKLDHSQSHRILYNVLLADKSMPVRVIALLSLLLLHLNPCTKYATLYNKSVINQYVKVLSIHIFL